MITGRLTVFVGDVNAYLRAAARAHDPAAFLVSNANWQQFCDTDYKTDPLLDHQVMYR